MKRILYDMGLLTLVRWLLQRYFKFEPLFGPGFVLKRVSPTQRLKKNFKFSLLYDNGFSDTCQMASPERF